MFLVLNSSREMALSGNLLEIYYSPEKALEVPIEGIKK